MKALVVEDEKKVQAFIRQALEQAGFVVDTASNEHDMMILLSSFAYDVLILDRLLRGSDSLCKMEEIRRARSGMKVLVLSALGDVEDKVRGLSEGADDYLGKPFHVEELVARVRELLRRSASDIKRSKDTVIEYEDLKIDLEKQRVYRGGNKIDLTKKEFQVLTLLARKPGAVFSKSSILDHAWDINHAPESNIVEVTIANLRAKLDRKFKPLIHSQRGLGYWFGEA
jgi:DNA-binding response OmpR family regulator